MEHKKKVKHVVVKKAKGGYITETHHHPPVAKADKPMPYNPSDYEPDVAVHPDLDAVQDHLEDIAPQMTVKPDDEPEAPKKGKSRYRRLAKDLDE